MCSRVITGLWPAFALRCLFAVCSPSQWPTRARSSHSATPVMRGTPGMHTPGMPRAPGIRRTPGVQRAPIIAPGLRSSGGALRAGRSWRTAGWATCAPCADAPKQRRECSATTQRAADPSDVWLRFVRALSFSFWHCATSADHCLSVRSASAELEHGVEPDVLTASPNRSGREACGPHHAMVALLLPRSESPSMHAVLCRHLQPQVGTLRDPVSTP